MENSDELTKADFQSFFSNTLEYKGHNALRSVLGEVRFQENGFGLASGEYLGYDKEYSFQRSIHINSFLHYSVCDSCEVPDSLL